MLSDADVMPYVGPSQAMKRGWIRYYWTGVVIQHLAQTAFLFLAIHWTLYRCISIDHVLPVPLRVEYADILRVVRQWFWVQSGFLTLHTFTMIMKVHSYCSYNGYLSEQSRELDIAKERLETVLKNRGSKDAVLREAAAAKAKQVLRATPKVNGSAISADTTATSAPTTHPSSTMSRRRHSGLYPKRRPSQPLLDEKDDDISLLEFHPDETVADLAISIKDLTDELVSTSSKVVWPANVTYSNYMDYLLVPTLVYELEYPRTTTCVSLLLQIVRLWWEAYRLTLCPRVPACFRSIRPLYVLERTLATFGTFSLILIITEHYIYPSIERIPGQTFLVSWLDLIPPFVLNFLLIFFISGCLVSLCTAEEAVY
jgi:sterol O-acyltransferase